MQPGDSWAAQQREGYLSAVIFSRSPFRTDWGTHYRSLLVRVLLLPPGERLLAFLTSDQCKVPKLPKINAQAEAIEVAKFLLKAQ